MEDIVDKNNLSQNNMNVNKKKLPVETDTEFKLVRKNQFGENQQPGNNNQQMMGQPQNNQPMNGNQGTYNYYPRDLSYMDASKTVVYTIPAGTLLYHGTMYRETFNPFDIKLGDDNLVAYFSPNKRLSADYIMGCATYPFKTGFIHKFRVKKDITKVVIVSSYEKRDNWNLDHISDIYCNNRNGVKSNGIGFFYPKKEKEAFNDVHNFSQSQMIFDSEFALCDPNEYLEYMSTQRCQSSRKLSAEYHFSQ